MSKVVYASDARPAVARLFSPRAVIGDLVYYRELIVACAQREYRSAHQETFLGVAWTLLTPLIMLAIFAFVFGDIFKGHFASDRPETPVDFALALFVGLSLFNCIGQALNQSPSLLLSNISYVKTMSFPLEILSVAQVANLLFNLSIALGLCIVGVLVTKFWLPWTAIFLLVHVACIALMSLGISWFLSSISIFVRDIPSIVSPLTTVLMFMSAVFFPIKSVPPAAAWVFKLNPLAIIIEQARDALLYGQVPNLTVLTVIFVSSFVVALLGHAFFVLTKSWFADVI